MTNSGATVIERLQNVVGSDHVLTATPEVEPFVVDWRGRYRGAARAVVQPASTAETSDVVRICSEANVPLVPQGGNTGMCGGATPDARGVEIVLSLARMRAIRDLDQANATITVEAGVTLAAVQEAARAAGLLFPLSLASEGSCTIGGNLATNAGGTAVLRYGNARELVLGIEVVLADGEVWNGLRALRKDNTGYDLKQLFIGSEGTLGIVTAAVLKLFAAPRVRVTALVAIADVARAVALLRALKQALGDRLTGFELVSGFAMQLSRKHHPASPDPLPGHDWYALVQVDDSAADAPLSALVEGALADAAEQDIITDATIAQSQEQADRLWALRENISESQRREGPNIKHDISLPISAIAEFTTATRDALLAAFPGVRVVVFGHLGDGNLHYNVAAPEDMSAQGRPKRESAPSGGSAAREPDGPPRGRTPEREARSSSRPPQAWGDHTSAQAFLTNTPQVNRIVHDRVVAAGGSISAEHGIGQLKRAELAHYKSPLELDLMRRIKTALDPRDLLNPGKVL